MKLRDSNDVLVEVNEDGSMPLLQVNYVEFGMAYTHNMPCAVKYGEPAVLKDGMFHPSWAGQQSGYFLVCVDPNKLVVSDPVLPTTMNKFRAWLLKRFFGVDALNRCLWIK